MHGTEISVNKQCSVGLSQGTTFKNLAVVISNHHYTSVKDLRKNPTGRIDLTDQQMNYQLQFSLAQSILVSGIFWYV